MIIVKARVRKREPGLETQTVEIPTENLGIKDYKNIEVLNALVAGYFLGLGYDVYDWETSNMVWSVLDMIDWNKEKYGKDGEFQIHVLPRKFTL